MNELPPGWEWITTRDLFAFVTSGSRGWARYYSDRGARFIRVGNLRRGSIDPDLTELQHVTPPAGSEGSRTRVQPNDILISITADLGRIALISDAKEETHINQHVALARPVKDVDVRYLAWYLSSDPVQQQWLKLQRGATKLGLGLDDIRSVTVPVPPLDEQSRIVAAIEEQFSRLDAGVAALKRARQNLERMRSQGVSSLFDPLWPRVPLAEVLTLFSDCPHRTPIYTEGGEYPALRPRDVVHGELRLQTSARVSEQEYRLQTARHAPGAGDIVYSRELSYGWAVMLPDEPPICLSQGMVLLRTKLLPGFLTLFLNSHEGRQQADKAATGTAHPHINLRDIRQYHVPLASHSDQRRVLALASELLSECDRASRAVAAAMVKAAALRIAVLSTAFSGKLVSQNPNDEPASVLLERIATERMQYDGHRPAVARKSYLSRQKVTA